MPRTGRTPTLQVRIIAAPALVDQLAPTLAAAARTLLGAGTTYTIQRRPAHRADAIRLYLTATRKDPADDQHHG